MEKQNTRIKTPWHLWFIGLFFIFLNGVGVYDYFMMLEQNQDYYNSLNLGEAVFTYFTDYPISFKIFWIANLSSGLIASILLLFRTHWAVPVVLICLSSLFILDVLTFVFRDRWHVFGPRLSLFDIAILLMMFVLFLYCRMMAKRGVLR